MRSMCCQPRFSSSECPVKIVFTTKDTKFTKGCLLIATPNFVLLVVRWATSRSPLHLRIFALFVPFAVKFSGSHLWLRLRLAVCVDLLTAPFHTENGASIFG